MGKPKFSRKKYVTPSHPWQEDRIKAENELIKKYGLKNKREIWKAQTALRRYRQQARTLLAKISSDPQAKKESDQLLMHLTRMSILPPNSNLDDVLALENEAILSRRLQTLTYLKGLANTPDHARQLISHGHIAIDGRKTTIPSYMVTKEEEKDIGYTSDSPLNATMHPARPRADFKSPIRKETGKPGEKPVKDIVKGADKLKKEPETKMQQPTDSAEPEKKEEPVEKKDSEVTSEETNQVDKDKKEETKPETPIEEPAKEETKNDESKKVDEAEVKESEQKKEENKDESKIKEKEEN